jgi:hypothetical protein
MSWPCMYDGRGRPYHDPKQEESLVAHILLIPLGDTMHLVIILRACRHAPPHIQQLRYPLNGPGTIGSPAAGERGGRTGARHSAACAGWPSMPPRCWPPHRAGTCPKTPDPPARAPAYVFMLDHTGLASLMASLCRRGGDVALQGCFQHWTAGQQHYVMFCRLHSDVPDKPCATEGTMCKITVCLHILAHASLDTYRALRVRCHKARPLYSATCC